MKKQLLLSCIFISRLAALPDLAREKGFVELSDIDPTIIISLRYLTHENFVGKPIKGYKKATMILTRQAALALKAANNEFKKNGYMLVIYDAYRPQQAVDHFVEWSGDIKAQKQKQHYYPRVNKADVFDLQYVWKRSGHSRGSTVDVTLIKMGDTLHPVIAKERTLLDGCTIMYLDDGTIDMGSSFDLFDIASHCENDLIPEKFKKMRTYLKNVMQKHGFRGMSKEWWHFTLKNEPYPADKDDSYFNFPVE